MALPETCSNQGFWGWRTKNAVGVLILNEMMYIYNNMLHNRVKLLRVEKGLSRKELAEVVGVNFQTIGYLERGDYNASLELAFKLAEYFEMPIEMIFNPKPFKSLAEQFVDSQAAE